MKLSRTLKKAGVIALAVALVTTGVSAPASAKTGTRSISLPSSNKLTAYAYIQDWADANGCGKFSTKASTSKAVPKLTHTVQWDPIGVGVAANVLGAGVSISGNNTGSPTASFSVYNRTSAQMTGTVCVSWGTFYLGVFSSASTKIGTTFYSTTVHL